MALHILHMSVDKYIYFLILCFYELTVNRLRQFDQNK